MTGTIYFILIAASNHFAFGVKVHISWVQFILNKVV